MTLTQFSINKDRVSFSIILFFLLSGILAFFEMPRAKDPDIISRTAVITTQFEGASPKRIESLITKPLERNIKQIEEIDYISSVSKNGVSIIYVNILEKYKEIAPIWNVLRKKLEEVPLPHGSSRPYVNDNYDDVYGTIITLTGDGFSYAELEEVAHEVKEEFYRIKEVGKVKLLGLQKEKIYIEFNNAKLSKLGLSPAKLASAIQTRNIITPGGSINIGPKRLIIEPTGNLNDLKELGRTIVPVANSEQVIYLEDIVSIKRDYAFPKDPIVHTKAGNGIAIAISMQKNSNIISLGKALKNTLTHLHELYPIGIEFQSSFDEPMLVKSIIDNFFESLLLSIALVIVIMFISLGWRSGVIVATLIPTTVFTSLMIMWQLGITLNQVSLAAMIISLGLLVDNAIVMSEAILIRLNDGIRPYKAAIGATSELKISLLTSSLTTAVAFLPIFIAESSASEYTAALFQVVAIMLGTSWVLSLTLTPLMSYLLLKPNFSSFTRYDTPMCNRFRSLLCFSMRYRYIMLGLVFIMFIASLLSARFLHKEFFPPSDYPTFLVRIALPASSSIEQTNEVAHAIEKLLEKEQDTHIQSYTSFIGTGAPHFWINYAPNGEADEYAEIIVNANSLESVNYLKRHIREYAIANFYDAKVTIDTLENGAYVEHPFEVRITGHDVKILRERAEEIKAKLQSFENVVEIEDDWGAWQQKLVVQINPSLAFHAGVTYEDIATSLQIALTGEHITQFRGDQKSIPILMRSNDALKKNLSSLQNTLIFVPSTGKSVPLTQVAKIDVVFKPPRIIRRDGVHTLTVHAKTINNMSVFDLQKPVDSFLKTLEWDVGYHYEFGGEIESYNRSMDALLAKTPIAFMIIFVLLITQFNSFKKTTLILITIPLSVIGVVLGLFATNTPYGFMTFLGIISLGGIVINNAIILIERIDYERTVHKLRAQDAIIEAAQRRMRPIVLTTLTTVGGLIPLWLTGGPLWEPMAVAMIFGLGFATILTLGVIPMLYSIFYRIDYTKEYEYNLDKACPLPPKKDIVL